MDGDKSYDHVKALVSSIHGSFTDASLLDRTNNNSPAGLLTAATTPSRTPSPSPSPSPDVIRTTTEDDSQAQTVSTMPADGQERAAADGATAPPSRPAESATSAPGNSIIGSTPTRLLQHRLRIPSLVVTSSLSPYHPGNLLAATADPDHTTPRRFSFAIMRRHSNTVPTYLPTYLSRDIPRHIQAAPNRSVRVLCSANSWLVPQTCPSNTSPFVPSVVLHFLPHFLHPASRVFFRAMPTIIVLCRSSFSNPFSLFRSFLSCFHDLRCHLLLLSLSLICHVLSATNSVFFQTIFPVSIT